MTDVSRIHAELISARKAVEASDNMADRVAFDAIAVKTLILSAASYFEREICQSILLTAAACKVPTALGLFIQKQGLERKYHSLFNWDAQNVNKFFSLFGDDTKAALAERSKTGQLQDAINNFLYINRARNNLVHENFAGATIELTFDEAWAKYEAANPFVEWFSAELKKLCAT